MTRSDWMEQVRRLARVGQACARTGDDVGEAVTRSAPDSQDRRRLIQAAVGGVAAAGLGIVAPPLLAATAQDARGLYARLTNTRGVAIIGAGLAGLACATELTRLGVPTQVFEAAQRVGGRCWSARNVFPGQVAERGAEFIGSSHHAMLGYARMLGLPLEAVDGSGGRTFHHFAGQRHSDVEIANEFRAFADFIREDLAPLGAPHAERFCARAEALDFMTLDEYLTLYGASGLLRSVLGNAFLGEFGSDLDEVSALAFLRFIYGDRRSKFGQDDAGGSLRVVGGNDLIASGLAQKLPRPVQLGHRLVALTRKLGGTTRLTFDLRGKYVQRDFDAVVLALPFSVLRDVEMRGVAMSSWKRQAIDKSEMGDSSRLLVGFSRPYWRESGDTGSGRSDLPSLQNAWETNPSRAGRAGAVIAHQVGGQAARNLLPATTQMDATGFVASLEEVLPGAMQTVTRDRRGKILATSQNWSIDPNSRGAFPRPQPGYFTRIAHAEATPVDGNLLFAGDHTSSFYEWQGFMEGAVLSGLRAASEACDYMMGR
jgi:monoamine oxidase